MILLVDNRDSFVYNLARYVEELGFACRVARSDAVSVEEVMGRKPAAVLLSPGPCAPDAAGVCMPLARAAAAHGGLPVLGVCLGHQAIAQALGGRIYPARAPRHGMAAEVFHDGSELFAGIPARFVAARYHSLAADVRGVEALRETAWDGEGEMMACAHVSAPIFGVQFHPESVLSEHGHALLANFLRIAGLSVGEVPRWAA